MKAISSSIVVLAGAYMVSTGLSDMSDPHKILFFVGSGVGILGLIGWLFQVVGKE
ncbi:MAG TPA: hypothetical protein VGM76_01295 [Lacipirellulaceae bacterium]|jgi:hypothetical protein